MSTGSLLLMHATTQHWQPQHGFLRVQGRDFVDEDGKPWQFRGYTVHYAINSMWPSSHPTDLDGVLDEMVELGANTLVGIGLHASPWKQANGWTCTPIEHPDYFPKLEQLFDRDRGPRPALRARASRRRAAHAQELRPAVVISASPAR